MNLDDREILAGLKAQDEQAYEELMNKYARYVGAIVVRISGNRLNIQDIEEICSGTFIKIWFSSGSIRITGENLKGYIGVTARNLTLNALRGKLKTSEDELEEDEIRYRSAEETAVIEEEMKVLKETIIAMSPLDREIFIRRYFYLERVKDIARDKRLNEKTVSTKLSRARRRLQLAIDERGI
ncbi:MAG: sigma-70 family RNA polymerase sigma factor [Eubacteriales bacterium]|nr:sigma-70 family RNA polymerase sigma factor [Eubacteriales bacterium]